jgi:hypothetical protein
MMVSRQEITDGLLAYQSGKIREGLGIGCELDDFLRFKKGSFNIILGHDNVGKTYWRMWYYLCLAVKHNKKFCVWSGENKTWQLVRDLIQWYTGRRVKDMNQSELLRFQEEVMQWFTFIPNTKIYTYDELLSEFEQGEYDGCMIDPYTGLKRKFTHEANYEFLSQSREWVNKTGITLDVCTHPVSSSGRGAESYYPKGHERQGSLKPPRKDDTEGGKPFANRCDDFIVVHRTADNEAMKFYTEIYVEKIKDVETGGKRTMREVPVMHEFNFGLGFKIGGIDPLRDEYILGNPDYIQKPLRPLSKQEIRNDTLGIDDFPDEVLGPLPF